MQFISGSLLLLILLSFDFCLAAGKFPFVILPSFFRANSTNSITVTPNKDHDSNQVVDIDVNVYKLDGGTRLSVFSEKLRAKQAGTPQTIKFPLGLSTGTLTVIIAVERHSIFQQDVIVKPDISTIHVHTDKSIYRAGEKIEVRVLPLTYANTIYNGPIALSLVNPDAFELTRKVVGASDTFSGTSFELPEHLYFGSWRIIARPEDDMDSSPYEASFTVDDYVLPPFKIAVFIQQGDPLDKTRITIDAKYHHGGTLNGSLVLSCSQNKNGKPDNTVRPTLIKQSQIIDGNWKAAVSLNPCFADPHLLSTTISAEIRDLGTGDGGEVRLEYDPLASSFDIIPLQPFFNSESEGIPFVTVPLGDVTPLDIEVSVTCIGMKSPSKWKSITSKIGEYFELAIVKERDDTKCLVLIVEARRILLDDSRSRSKTIVIPYLPTMSSYNPSWIQIMKPKGFYNVGDKIDVRINKGKAKIPKNYMVLCNSFDIVSVGKIRDDNTLKIPVTPNMLGECYVFVYTNNVPYTVDMVLFFVNERCEVKTSSSAKELKPGHNVTFHLSGDANGLAIIRAINDKLTSLNRNSENQRYKSWDFGLLESTDPKDQQSRLYHFVNRKDVRRETEKKCEAAGSLYSDMFRTCPDAKASNSMISDFCLKRMIDKCLNPPTGTTAYSCATSECAGQNAVVKQIETVRTAGPILGIRARNFVSAAEPIFDEPVLQPDDDGSPIRHHFHEVWLFDAFKLGASGTIKTTVTAPDDIGRWSIDSAYWSPGHQNLCKAETLEIVSKKSYFMEVDIPRHAYSNESVTVKVSVTALKPQKEKKLSVCLMDLPRKVCADLGTNGQTGQSVYSRVIVSPANPVFTKTFTMKFLGDGDMSILFRLREETEFPGKHHCDIGKIYDSVRIKTKVSRRVEAEEMYKVLIVDPDKPMRKNDFPRTTRCKDSYSYNYYDVPSDNPLLYKKLDVTECRGPNGEMYTEVLTNIPDSDVVQSFTVDIDKFLPNKQKSSFAQRRVKRNRITYQSLYLNEVLMKLSVELYNFKSLKKDDTAKLLLERSENEIGNLVSDMLRFSDCHTNEKMCGFSEYDSPTNESQRDPLLTAIASSLICQAAIDNKMACGPMKYIENLLLKNERLENVDVSHLIDLDDPADRRWFLLSMFYQVLNDCAALQCPKNETAWLKLYHEFFDVDESLNFDDRTLAALAFLSTSSISEIMRIKMMGRRNDTTPFWTAGKIKEKNVSHRMSTFEKQSIVRKSKTGDVLVNSLGILSFIVLGAENERLNWDSLASWLYEQQQADGTFSGVLDTFFATRAIHEYRFRKINESNEMQLKIICENGPTYEVNVTNTATEFYFPTNVRNFTLVTKGQGKLRFGIHVLASKKQRSRRGLTQFDYYPVRFSIDQEVIANGVLKQTVCVLVRSLNIKDVEITHGIYTGYSLKPSNVNMHQNTSSATFLRTPSVSSYAAHFIIDDLQKGIPACYEVGLTEPNYHHEPLYLAPVSLQAKHVSEGVVGMALVTHPDQLPRFQQVKHSRPQFFIRRSRRSIIEESVDTVCFEGGACSCAETTCSVKCGLCGYDTADKLKESLLQDENKFIILGEAVKVPSVISNEKNFTVIRLDIKYKKGYKKQMLTQFLNVWVQDCSSKCLPEDGVDKLNFFVLGDVEGIYVDSSGEQQYVLRDTDRLEVAADCSNLSTFTLSRQLDI